MGASFVENPAANFGRSTGSPAPDTIRSAPAAAAAFTYSPYFLVATMILKPSTPSGAIFLAFFSSFAKALRFAPKGSRSKSGSLQPICAVEIKPTPPAFATAPASPERLIPTPIPP